MFIKNPLVNLCSTALIAAALTLPSCKPIKPGVYANDKVPASIKSTLGELNNSLLAALKSNNENDLKGLISQELIQDRGSRLKITEGIAIEMKKADYSLAAEYYVYSTQGPSAEVVQERAKGINNFDLTVNREAPETYIALFIPKSAPQKWVIAATYNHYNYGWKVASLEVNPYAENGKTSPELVQYSKNLLKKGYWLDAINAASYAVNTLRPLANWKYVNEDNLYQYCVKGLDSVKRKHKLLSIKLPDVPNAPKIWRITLERNADGAFPNINYISKINLLDTTALKKENQLVQKAITRAMPGIDKDKKFIYYTIYNETKQGVPYHDHFDIRQKL